MSKTDLLALIVMGCFAASAVISSLFNVIERHEGPKPPAPRPYDWADEEARLEVERLCGGGR